MAKWKLLHLIGAEASAWRVNQLAGQYRLGPEELFEPYVAAGEERTARQIEAQILGPVRRLGRRFKIELTAARNLRTVLRQLDPDLIVCWDIPATEQLRLARRGSRRQIPAVAMLFFGGNNRELVYKLKSSYQALNLHLVGAGDRICQWARTHIPSADRVHRIYPLFERTADAADKNALRRQMGLEPEAAAVFIPTEGRLEENYQAIIGCGINEKVFPNIRIVLAGANDERLARCRRFTAHTIVPPILRVVRDWNVRQVIGVCDLVVQPLTRPGESLALVEAMGRGVPVIATAHAEPADLLVPNHTFWDLGKLTGRAVATGIYKLLTDPTLRQTLTDSARQAVHRHCAPSDYRAAVVKLYQQILTPRL